MDKKQLPWADYCEEYGIDSDLVEPGVIFWVGAEGGYPALLPLGLEEARILTDLADDETLDLNPAVRQGDPNDLNRYWVRNGE